jgi:penicillin-binding protein 1A
MSTNLGLGSIRHRPLDFVFAGAIVLLGLPLIAGGLAAAVLYLYFVKVPPPVALPEPKVITAAKSTHIYAADGSLIAKLSGDHNRIPIRLNEMPRHFVDAAIASEDSRFYEHSGVDARSILRALNANLKAGKEVQGGSTITQQYVKLTYLGNERTLIRKIREAQIASQLEKTESKQKILEAYLNSVFFGRGAYGVEAAANAFFGKPASQLTVSESALLVGVIPTPTRFSPDLHPASAERRRLEVIRRMQVEGYLDGSEADAARADKPKLTAARPTEEILKYPWFVDAVKRYLLYKYGRAAVFENGMEVYSTIDPALQDKAEAATHQALPDSADPYDSLVSIDPSTGYVKAIVGGRDYNKEKYNIAIQGRRQPGSSFKPFVLIGALEAGTLPSTTYNGPATICIPGWRPDCQVSNYDQHGYGRITLEQATFNSVNTVFAQVIMNVGPEQVVAVAKRMGIPGPRWLPARSGCTPTSTDACGTKIEALPALALGSEEVTPFEMASAFATLAARGIYREPKVVTKIVSGSGDVLESGPAKPVKALDEQIADNATAILQEVITRGTGTRANIGRPAAGKTGTASDYQNAWFVGYVPELSTAVWMGFKGKNLPLINIRGVPRVTGGTIPAMIWANYMKQALANAPITGFADASQLQTLQLPFRPTPSPSPTFQYEPDIPPDLPSPEPSPVPPPAPQGLGGLLGGLLGVKPSPPPSPVVLPSPSPAAPSPFP